MIFKSSSGSNCLAHPGMLKILPSQNFFSSGKVRTVPHKSRCQSLVIHSQGLYQATVCQITSPFLKNWSIFVACLNCFQLVSAFPLKSSKPSSSQSLQVPFSAVAILSVPCFRNPFVPCITELYLRVKWCNSSHCRLTCMLEPNCSDLLCFILGSSGIIVSALI